MIIVEHILSQFNGVCSFIGPSSVNFFVKFAPIGQHMPLKFNSLSDLKSGVANVTTTTKNKTKKIYCHINDSTTKVHFTFNNGVLFVVNYFLLIWGRTQAYTVWI
jgi:hypothetical protein